ncbi:succinoglycan biosynthesis protein ExoA [Sphingomonas jinjuensis]|uniref:Succinoglycan biosynthesis protein ExoA n=1 Tax=Sphingomonas jinjuensis TaxID=535907 RepID=A0A840F7E9_9SPHN|nr:glycosyltransferase family 2 protein [Sphingomonas jinjuensis]MBB4152246.1 succinoglycan biosynthesis protein ExoA [Sphingomonas jinjuensis]
MTRRAVVIIPTLNEADQIGGLLAQFARNDPARVVQILVADGGSTDATRDIVADAAATDARIALIDNPARRQAPGINRAVAAAMPDADTIIRVDAHAGYPDDYAERILACFAETGADMVATRLATIGTTCRQRAIAAASNSRAGTGGAAHRVGGEPGWIDHGHHAGMDRRLFEMAGGYDDGFDANEDAELDYRIRRVGGRIWMAADIVVDYHPRRTFRALAVQYFRYGTGRARTFLKHRERLRPRQLAAPAIVVGLAASMIGGLASPWLLLPAALYAGAVAFVAIGLAVKLRSGCALGAAPAIAVMHVAWGIGFLRMLASSAARE